MKPFSLSAIIITLTLMLYPAHESPAASFSFRIDKRAVTSANRVVRGITRFPRNGAPGPLQVFGRRAVPLVMDRDDRAVAALAAHGRGYAVAMGHNGWLDKKMLQEKQVQRFLSNCISLSRKRRPRILTFNARHVYSHTNKKYRVTNSKTLPSNLARYDIIFSVIPTRGEKFFQEVEASRIRKWVSRGGVFIGASIGWVFHHYGPGKKGKNITRDFIANRLFLPMGIHFGLGYAKGKNYAVEPIRRNSARLRKAHSGLIINELMAGITGSRRYKSHNEARKEISRAFRQLDGVPDIRWILSKRQIAEINRLFLRGRGNSFPTLEKPVDILSARQTALIILMDKILRTGSFKHPAYLAISREYPGIAKNPIKIKKKVTVDLSVPRWHSTGLWLNPFDQLKVTLPKEAVSRGLKIKIGCHKDNLFLSKRVKAWERWPNITKSVSLFTPTSSLSSPYGGLVYIDVPKKLKGTITITLDGATPAPLFILGKTDQQDWRYQVNRTRSPRGEIKGKYVIIETSTAALKKDYDVKKVAVFWDAAMLAIYDLGQKGPKPYPERFVIDRQLSSGYMHSGYPMVTSYKPEMDKYVLGFKTRRGELFKEGSWGHFHEAGHNNQNRDWTYRGSGEVTVNLFTLYAMERVLGIKPYEHKAVKKAVTRKKEFIARGTRFSEWKKDPILALLMYIELQQKFGWDSYKKVFRVYNNLSKSERPKTDSQKRDQWVLRYSLAVGHDLTGFFERWGFPFDKKIKRKLRHLPKWPARSSR